MNPAVQADSSIRGGSSATRQSGWKGPLEPSGDFSQDRVKADSSVRGGSNQARYSDRASRSSTEGNRDRDIPANPERDLQNPPEQRPFQYLESPKREDFGQSTARSRGLNKANDSLLGSANWNPSDDLLPDGPENSESGLIGPFESNNDASVGGAARFESGHASGISPLDDINVPINSDLNSSSSLEKNISGEYDIDDQADVVSSDLSKSSSSSASKKAYANPSFESKPDLSPLNHDAVGGPGSTETGISSFPNNDRYGQPSKGEIAEFGDPRLAERVKATLTRESTGVYGPTSREIARNIQVTGHGGTVTLKGSVPSQQDKDMIEIRVKEMTGVDRVNNQLSVTPHANPAVRNLGVV